MCAFPSACNKFGLSLSPQFEFERIFAEDINTKMHSRPKEVFKCIYYYTKLSSYYLLVFTFGFLLMICYALLFALYAFCLTWIFIPLIQSTLLILRPCARMPMQIVEIAFSPSTERFVKTMRRICPQRWYREDQYWSLQSCAATSCQQHT